LSRFAKNGSQIPDRRGFWVENPGISPLLALTGPDISDHPACLKDQYIPFYNETSLIIPVKNKKKAYRSLFSPEGSSMGDISKSLGRRIRSLRVSRELSQDALAEKAGMSVKHLGKIERGTVNASIQCLTDIGKALDMPLRDILETEHEQDREELLAELVSYLPQLPLKDVRIVYRLVTILAGR
jgi:transcriptional regulator with XRE-family HTH domain